jgi:hypothetical protein
VFALVLQRLTDSYAKRFTTTYGLVHSGWKAASIGVMERTNGSGLPVHINAYIGKTKQPHKRFAPLPENIPIDLLLW